MRRVVSSKHKSSGAQSPPVASQSGSSFLVFPATKGGDAAGEAKRIYGELAVALSTSGLEIVQERVFGSLSLETAVRTARREVFEAHALYDDNEVTSGLTYLQGKPTWGDGLAGVIVHAIAGSEARTVFDGDEPCGRTWQSGGVRFMVLQNIQGLGSPSGDSSRGGQVRRAIERADRILKENGLRYCDTLRTWFYISRILDWYGEFNQSRNEVYSRFGMLPCMGGARCGLPASTGIRADFSSGAACSLDLVAATGCDRDKASHPARKSHDVCECVRNPLQPEAISYGSAFSRCTIANMGSSRLIEVSGTASIDEKGQSVYLGDIRGQVRCTLEKLTSLLQQAHASLSDIRAATLFLKHGRDEEAVRDVLAEFRLSNIPAIWVEADVCRDDLLFEIDAEAMVRDVQQGPTHSP